jgi:tripartite-type tricarboxylate transporter receptor subunit TctC
MQRRHLISIGTAAALAPLLGEAQSDKTVRILVGFPPGGSLDTVARLLADKMKDELKANLVVENRPGAGGRIAAELLKNAAPDGNTLMMCPIVIPVLAPLVFSKLNYNPATDFAPVGHAASFQFALTVPAASPAKNVADWLAWVKANPKQANFGSPSPGSLPHFFGEMLSREAKADLVHVPFQGGAPMMTALLGNQLSAGIDVALEAVEQHKAGRVRVLATSGDSRSAMLPDVATFKEQGFANLVAEGWMAMYAPAKTPEAVLASYNRALVKALAAADVKERFAQLGLVAGGGSAADLTRLEQASSARWGAVVKATGFRAD